MRSETSNGNGSQSVSRRKFATLTAGALTTGLAGCFGGTSTDDDQNVAVASFFTFYDFTRQIVDGTPMSVDNLVPVGLHGHGWEPDPSITQDIVDADAFVHVGPDFQPWADRAIETVHDDDAGTHLINAREGVELLDLAETVEDDEEIESGKDPHFWLDPGLAKQAVDNIATGLAEVAPDHEGEFADNADDLKGELDELDAEWEAIFEEAEREYVFLAAHNAFEYLGQRYGATIQPLIANLAATDDVRTSDRQYAQDMIAEHDIQYIGAAIFEPNSWAKQLVDETDAEAYYPVTPYAGTKEEWIDQDWGYFDIARNINMPTFEIVLDAAGPEETDLGEEWRNFD
ncbi:metal ABC transporter substrate-binding protein [Halobacteria archaeon AArc-m2/3/4]|uniref:Metal ABC transporter substrate-binding protein n=1 Tax=Natronoglomus mannanivorans TaxID=2979990 RepID=A0AAP2Z2N3_9EURY|nr:metal ABC transporter substrate-binding protein [Halobacteria archaeon AArc-xg1-1]MCU4972823.1 metal ABC transporter substrate-binding protein [Halobacteria archaeon AArc-m2/3/4]